VSDDDGDDDRCAIVVNDGSYVGRDDTVGGSHVSVIQGEQEVPHGNAHPSAEYRKNDYVRYVGHAFPTITAENGNPSGPHPSTVTVQDQVDITVPDWTKLTDGNYFRSLTMTSFISNQ